MSDIVKDLIAKCEAASLSNRGATGGPIGGKSVFRKSGKTLAEDPAPSVSNYNLFTGDKTFTLKIDNANLVEGGTITYASSDTSVATVSAKGVVTKKGAGTCTISATYEDADFGETTVECKVTSSNAVAKVGDQEFASIDEAAVMAEKKQIPLIPLSNSVTYTFKDLNEHLLISKKYNGANIYFKAPKATKDSVYAVYYKKAEVGVDEYFVMDIGTPEIEFTNVNGVKSYMNSGTAFSTKGTYKFLKDTLLAKTIYCDLGALGGDITIDLNGCTVTADENTGKGHSSQTLALLDVVRANVVVNGNGGKLLLKEGCSQYYGIHNRYGYTITLNDVDVKAAVHAVYSQQGTFIINGGHYEVYPSAADDPYKFTLNCLDSSYTSGKAAIKVNSGRFYKFNPADNTAEGPGTNFVVDGHTFTYDEATEEYIVWNISALQA